MADGYLKSLMVKIGVEVDEFEKNWDAAVKTVEKKAKDIQKIGEDLTKYITLPVLALGAAFITMGAQEEKAFHRLGNSVQLAGTQWSQAREPVLGYISALQSVTEFDEADIANALNTLTITTGNAQTALNALQTTLDISASGLMDLDTAARLVGRSTNGNTEAFKRYGVQLNEGASATEVLRELSLKFHGQAMGALETVAGAAANLKNKLFDAAETMGHSLEPLTMKAIAALGGLATMLNKAADWFSRLTPESRAFVVAVALIAAAIGPALVLFAKMISLGKEVGGALQVIGIRANTSALQILFLATVALVVASNWEKTKSLLESIWRGIVMGIMALGSMWADVLTFMIKKVADLINFVVQHIPFLPQAIKDAFSQVVSIVKTSADETSDKFQQWSTDAYSAFQSAAQGIDSGGTWIGNTVDMIGGKVIEAMNYFSGLKASIEGLATAPPKVAVALTGFALFFSKWAKELKDTAANLAKDITDNLASMTATMVSSLAKGTFDAKKMLMDFLVQTLEAVISWAMKGMFAAMGLSEALTAAFANPWIAAGVIIGLIGLVAGLSAAFKSEAGTAMATGGISQGPMNAIIGDNPSGEEAVLPLDNARAGQKIASFLGGGTGGGMQVIIEMDGRQIAEKVFEYMPGVFRMQGINV